MELKIKTKTSQDLNLCINQPSSRMMHYTFIERIFSEETLQQALVLSLLR